MIEEIRNNEPIRRELSKADEYAKKAERCRESANRACNERSKREHIEELENVEERKQENARYWEIVRQEEAARLKTESAHVYGETGYRETDSEHQTEENRPPEETGRQKTGIVGDTAWSINPTDPKH